MKIIINADDLGINKTVNKSIDEFLEKAVISSATILANGKAFDDVKEIVVKHPKASFGVHLNLTEFASLTQSPVLARYGITTKDGEFVKGMIFKSDINKELRKAIYLELKAQILKIMESGIEISHFDGHHHCHLQPQLFGVIRKLAREFGVKRIRQNAARPLLLSFKKVKYTSRQFAEKAKNESIKSNRSFLLRFNNSIKSIYWYYRIKFNYITTDLFLSYAFYEMNKESIEDIQNLTIELMCHPGHPAYKIESSLILGLEKKNNLGYRLINFMDL